MCPRDLPGSHPAVHIPLGSPWVAPYAPCRSALVCPSTSSPSLPPPAPTRTVNSCGFLMGHTTTSWMRSLAVCCPAMSLQSAQRRREGSAQLRPAQFSSIHRCVAQHKRRSRVDTSTVWGGGRHMGEHARTRSKAAAWALKCSASHSGMHRGRRQGSPLYKCLSHTASQWSH